MRAPPCSADPTEIFAPDVIEDPHPFFARVRNQHAISRVGESGVHLVASWALIDEVLRRDDDFCYGAIWEFQGVGNKPTLHKEHLTFDNVALSTRSYK